VSIYIAKLPDTGGNYIVNGQDSKQENYEASGLSSSDTVDSVKAALYSQFGITKNSVCSGDSTQRCQNISVAIKPGGLAAISVSYAVPPSGGFQDRTNPLTQPAVVSLQPFYISDKTEQDALGNTLVSGAGVPFENPQELRITGWRLTIKKNYAAFDWG